MIRSEWRDVLLASDICSWNGVQLEADSQTTPTSGATLRSWVRGRK